MLMEENKVKNLTRGVLSILRISRQTCISFSFIVGKKKSVNHEKFYCPGFYFDYFLKKNPVVLWYAELQQ